MAAKTTRPKLRIGVILDSIVVSKYIFEFVKWSQVQEQLELSNLFLLPPRQEVEISRFQQLSRASKLNRAPSIISKLFFRLIIGIEKLLLLKNRRHRDHLQKVDLSALIPNGIIHALSNDGVFSLNSSHLDLLITFTTSASVSKIWNAAKLGAIFISHSDERVHQGGPAGFWEVYFRDDVTGFTIQRLMTDVQGAGEVLLRGRVATQFYYLLNQASLFEKSIYYLARIIEKIAITRQMPKSEPSLPFCYSPRSIPRAHETLFYLMGLIRLATSKMIDKARGFDFRWHVAFARSDWRKVALWRATVIENPHRRYLADPFVINRDGKDFCYVEDYDEVTKRAKIAVYELGSHSATYVGIALEERFHLSYPYLFEYENELYMCPETSENRDIRIYKCLEFPLHWQLEKVIMRNISAVDSILFEKNAKWWLLTNIDPARWDDFSLELHIFSAKSPLEEEWIPHPLNPLLIDAARGRNGGMVKDGDRLFRVAQGQGFGMYGKRTSVNEIVVLNDEEYVEKCACVISPKFRKGLSGTHHLHSNGILTVIDFA